MRGTVTKVWTQIEEERRQKRTERVSRGIQKERQKHIQGATISKEAININVGKSDGMMSNRTGLSMF